VTGLGASLQVGDSSVLDVAEMARDVAPVPTKALIKSAPPTIMPVDTSEVAIDTPMAPTEAAVMPIAPTIYGATTGATTARASMATVAKMFFPPPPPPFGTRDTTRDCPG